MPHPKSLQRRTWFSAGELAGLPSLPGTDRGVKLRAEREGWRSRVRQKRGGGFEYHLDDLPVAARLALLGVDIAAPAVETVKGKKGVTKQRRRLLTNKRLLDVAAEMERALDEQQAALDAMRSLLGTFRQAVRTHAAEEEGITQAG